MDVRTAIETRRAVRKFDPAHVIGEDKIRELMSLTLLSPTAFNIQHWRFVLVRDKALREEIRAACWMQPQITEASLLVVVCADVKAWQKAPERYWRTAPAEVREGLLEGIRQHYTGRERFQVEEAMRSCGMAAQTLMLAARSMGYDTSPMDLGDVDVVAKLIDLPENHVIAMYVAVGKGIEAPYPRGGQLAHEEVVMTDRF
ncbi:MAG: nitroreductase family protein [Rhodocyclaceae bacterium]|nr:nitroreductase family protein [Rhodocyclaceae bacterium]